MARKKKPSIEDELKRIEDEEKLIESEEQRIEKKEDVIEAFEELGLMRWKSYYILTAGAILLLALTFVTALWVMHGQIGDLQTSVDMLSLEMAEVGEDLQSSAAAAEDWCPEGRTVTMNLGAMGSSQIEIMGEEVRNGTTICQGVITTVTDEGLETMEITWDQQGNVQMS